MRTFLSSLPFALAALAVLLLASAAATADEGSSSVKGQVTYKGVALAKGRILFHFDNDQMIGAKIKDGQYSIKKIPPGEYQITVESEGIPMKYSRDDTTPLKFVVKKGSQNHDVAFDD
jgi:hypothetical protein